MGDKLNAEDLQLKMEVGSFGKMHHLSAREQDIILLLVNGYGSSEEIARRLTVSVSTVKNHLHSIFQKTETKSKAELLASFIAHNAGWRERDPEAPLAAPLKILVADDDQNFRELIARAMKKLGVPLTNVTFVSNGLEVVQQLEQVQRGESQGLPDIILLDLIMPELDGLKTLEILKSNAYYAQIPVITLTNSDDEETVSKTYSLGGHSYFLKPQSFKDLVDMVAVITTYWSGTIIQHNA